MSLAPALKERFDKLVQSDRVVLFMKGNRRMPQCGFSSRVVGILDGLLDEYETVNVLDDPAIRQGVKDYSDWPTIPQLYIDGEFQGGCDIVTEMASNGELHSALGIVLEEVATPSMTLTDDGRAALDEALAGTPDGEFLRLRIPSNWRYELKLGPRGYGDVEVDLGGHSVLLDRATAKIAEGTVIDFVKGAMGAGFKISNPNEPVPVQQATAAQVKAWLDAGEAFEFFDVRPESERAVASIGGARILDDAAQEYIFGLDKGTKLVFHCHHGMRSQQAAEHFWGEGFKNVHNLAGGIQAWSAEVDPTVPTY